jgi:hypothetical protein
MKWLCALPLLALAATPPLVAAQAPANSPKARGSGSHAPSRSRHAKSKRAAHKRGPSYQLHPDPQRYQEIQKALADRGYFKGTVNGEWGDDSVDALKRFQADQKLPDDGKINSPSLIGLGLGPKHNGSSASPPVQPASVPEPVAPSSSVETPRTGTPQ